MPGNKGNRPHFTTHNFHKITTHCVFLVVASWAQCWLYLEWQIPWTNHSIFIFSRNTLRPNTELLMLGWNKAVTSCDHSAQVVSPQDTDIPKMLSLLRSYKLHPQYTSSTLICCLPCIVTATANISSSGELEQLNKIDYKLKSWGNAKNYIIFYSIYQLKC